MRKWSRILFVVVALAAVGGIGWVLLRTSEPAYKGKRLSVWLEDYDKLGDSLHNYPPPPETNEALRSIGTNAIPTLLRRLSAKDSTLTTWLVDLAGKQHFFKVNFKSVRDKQQEGTYGFLALGAAGKDAVPELIKMFETDHHEDCRSSVALALGSIGPAAEQAVPMLVRSLGDTRSVDRSFEVLALGHIHARPEIALPALIKCLNDKEIDMRLMAFHAIVEFGVDSKVAVPDLIKLLADPDKIVVRRARDALKKIDPDAAEKAGVVK